MWVRISEQIIEILVRTNRVSSQRCKTTTISQDKSSGKTKVGDPDENK
jgi:hypothetical protein